MTILDTLVAARAQLAAHGVELRGRRDEAGLWIEVRQGGALVALLPYAAGRAARAWARAVAWARRLVQVERESNE